MQEHTPNLQRPRSQHPRSLVFCQIRGRHPCFVRLPLPSYPRRSRRTSSPACLVLWLRLAFAIDHLMVVPVLDAVHAVITVRLAVALAAWTALAILKVVCEKVVVIVLGSEK